MKMLDQELVLPLSLAFIAGLALTLGFCKETAPTPPTQIQCPEPPNFAVEQLVIEDISDNLCRLLHRLRVEPKHGTCKVGANND